MTYEEALNFNQKWTEEQAFNDLERYLLREERPAYKAVAICMRAAKTKIPLKPIVAYREAISGIKHYSCPVELCHSMLHTGANFCEHCGQALDWVNE